MYRSIEDIRAEYTKRANEYKTMRQAWEAVTIKTKKNGDEYAEEKLRQRASQVSGVQVKYQHEAEKETWKQMQKEKDGDHDL